MKKETTVSCPLCGAEFTRPMSEFTTVEAVIGMGSCMCIVRSDVAKQDIPTKPSKTAKERIEALRNAGVDVSNLFAMQGANGGDFIASNKDGNLVILDNDNPIFNYITNQGTVPNRKLFRRFVMAKMFYMMSHIPYGQKEPIGVTGMIHRLGYEYQWKMLMNELHAQMKIEGKDAANFADRNRWFHVGIVVAMAKDYIEQLKKHINSRPIQFCKGIPYIRIGGRNIFVEDLQAKLFHPLCTAIRRIEQTNNATQLYNTTKKFNDLRVKMKSNTPQCKEWIDAYKGAGAYFTMQNLIRFHNCSYVNKAVYPLDKAKSLDMILFDAEKYKNGEGWRLLGILKKMLSDNNIDVQKKMKEWRKRK